MALHKGCILTGWPKLTGSVVSQPHDCVSCLSLSTLLPVTARFPSLSSLSPDTLSLLKLTSFLSLPGSFLSQHRLVSSPQKPPVTPSRLVGDLSSFLGAQTKNLDFLSPAFAIVPAPTAGPEALMSEGF